MKKEIKWGSPKEYQGRRKEKEIIADELAEPEYETLIVDGEPMEVMKEPPNRKKPPKSKVCRKLKGPHVYGDWAMYHFGWERDKTKPSGWYVRYCKGCNRKDTWIAPNLPGPYWRLDLDARPPLDK